MSATGTPEQTVSTLHQLGVPGQRPAVWRTASGSIRRIAYEPFSPRVNLWKIRLDGDMSAVGEPVLIAPSDREDAAPQFSPDGQRVAFSSTRDGARNGIYVYSIETGQTTRLKVPGSFRGSPRWSPDGKALAFDAIADDGKNRDIWIVNLLDGGVRRLTSAPTVEARPSWSKDGHWIYFASNPGGRFDIWKQRAEPGRSTAPIRITQDGGFEAFEAPDGRALYYTKTPEIDGIWRIPTTGGGPSELVERTAAEGHWSVTQRGILLMPFSRLATSRHVAYLSHGKTGSRSRIFDLAGDASRVYPGFSATQDGSNLIVPLLDNHGSHIVFLHAAKAGLRPGP